MVAAVTLVVLFLALVAWRKGWHLTGILALCLGVAYAVFSQPGIQSVLRAQADARAQGGGIQPQVASMQQAVDELSRRAAAQEASVTAHEERLAKHEEAVATQQQAWQRASEELQARRQQLEAQQHRLERVESFVQDVLGGSVTDELWLKDRERVIVLPKDGTGSRLYFQLSQVPRPDTVKLAWHKTVFPTTAYTIRKNTVSLTVTGPTKGFQKHPFVFQYVADTGRAQEAMTLSLRDGVVYAGEEPLAE